MASSNMYNNMCLIGAMDRLWFHQVILLSQPNNVSLITPQTIISLDEEQDQAEDSSFKSQSPTLSTSSLEPDEDIDTDSSSPSSETPKKEIKRKCERMFNISRSNRSLPSLSKSLPRDRRSRSLSRPSRLEKTMSCKSLGELELEEVKGFLDLGFTFKKEQLSPRMITLIPGLQRLDSMSEDKEQEEKKEEEEEEEDEKGVIIRPYLSEAWLIRKPSSPLLSLKVPRASQASDMKKHLKFWARVVASEIQQES